MPASCWFLALLFLAAPGLTTAAAGERNPNWLDPYDRLLAKYVSDAGVKYAAWKSQPADMNALEEVVEEIGKENVEGQSTEEKLAFYLNAYNAWILHETLGKYPTRSVKDLLFTFFLSKRIRVGGKQMSFDELEKNVIRRDFAEPRVHCALNCASKSCPPLQPKAFRGDQLDGDLEALAVAFVNSRKGVAVAPDGKSAELSMIFNWYQKDFKSVGGPVAFINQRRQPPLPNDIKITYQKYDWSLNEAQ